MDEDRARAATIATVFARRVHESYIVGGEPDEQWLVIDTQDGCIDVWRLHHEPDQIAVSNWRFSREELDYDAKRRHESYRDVTVGQIIAAYREDGA